MSRAVICAAILAAACGGGSSPTAPEAPAPATLTPVQATSEWPASTPEAEGLDPSRLGELAVDDAFGPGLDGGELHGVVLVSTAENPDGRGIAPVEFLHAYVLAAVRG